VDLAGLSYTPSHFYSYGKTWGTKSSTPAIGDAVLFTNYDPTKPKPTDTKQAYGIAHVAIVVATSADKTHFASVGGNEQNQVERDPKTASEPEYASAPGTPWGKLFVYEFIAPVLKPVAPTSVKATISKMSPLTVSLTWAESSYPDSFTIKRTNNTTGIGTQWPEPASTRSYSDTSVVFGDTYTYTVCAVTVVEPSACSSTSITVLPSQLVVTLTPSSQWVVAGNAAAWTVSWSGGSGSYSLSFSNGDNFSTSWTATAAGSTSFSKVMSAYPCSGDSATSTQTFIVTDSKYTPHKVTVTSTTRVNPGKLC
jgi:hypothetical protein